MKAIEFIIAAMFLSVFLACSDQKIEESLGGGSEVPTPDETERPMTVFQNRGMVVSYNPDEKGLGALVSWKWLGSDPDDATYDIYRSVEGGEFEKLNTAPIQTTNFKDTTIDVSKDNTYQLRFSDSDEVIETYEFTATMASTFYRSIMLNMSGLPDTNGDPYLVSDGAVGDLDGDGDYELVVKRQTISVDNSFNGSGEGELSKKLPNGSVLLEAYDLKDGHFMWRVDLGPNIRQGTHYVSFIVYDLDGDGKAELAVRTSEGTKFGDGTIIGDVNGDERTYYVDINPDSSTFGKILEGPEFLSVIDGTTGTELARTDYIPRGDESQWTEYWGDAYGNRMDRFLMAVGHFVSENSAPSIVMCRGYYVNWQMTALDYDNGELKERWHFDTYPIWQDYKGQGNHNLAVGDVDGDGKDEIVYGACCIDHDGKGLYTTGRGHGDALHLGKFDPDREGLQVVQCHEDPSSYGSAGTEMRDAATGELLVAIPGGGADVGRCMVADIDPETPGCELWSSACGDVLWSCKGEQLSKPLPTYKGHGGWSYNMGIWWNGSLNRQTLDHGYVRDYANGENVFFAGDYGTTVSQGTKDNPVFYGDIWGDWREEQIYRVGTSADANNSTNTELRIFTTNYETNYRFRPLMNDHIYKLSATHENVGYNQPTHTGFYLGSDLDKSDRD